MDGIWKENGGWWEGESGGADLVGCSIHILFELGPGALTEAGDGLPCAGCLGIQLLPRIAASLLGLALGS